MCLHNYLNAAVFTAVQLGSIRDKWTCEFRAAFLIRIQLQARTILEITSEDALQRPSCTEELDLVWPDLFTSGTLQVHLNLTH